MEYIVRYGDTLWDIAKKHLNNPSRWTEIAFINRINDHDNIFIGQRLKLPSHTPSMMGLYYKSHLSTSSLGRRQVTMIPARAFFFVVADEINPFTRKVVRKVAFPHDLQGNPELAKRIINPEKYGFSPKDPISKVSLGRHVLGRTDSKFISASEKPFGSPRFEGKHYWIDVNKLKKSGGTIHEAEDIARDLDRIVAKAKKDPEFLQKINKIIELSRNIDKEIVIEGEVAASMVKGAKAMAVTRGLQFVSGVGIIMSAHDLGKATVQSYRENSVKPIAAETIRQVGGWAAAVEGMELGATTGTVLGIETGPGAVVTAGIGGIIGGVAGYFGFDWIADHIHEN